MSNEELMSQVKDIFDHAAEDIRQEQKAEHIKITETLAASINGSFTIDDGKVMLFLMYQTPLAEVDRDNALNAHAIGDMTPEQAEAEGFSGGRVQMPYTFDSMADAVENMNSKVAAVMADMAAQGRGWASVTAHKHQATTIYLCVAGGCITVTKVLPTGDKLSECLVRGGTTSSPPALESLPSEASDLAQAQWQFTCTPQVLRQDYPKAYQAMVKEIMSKMEGLMGDDE